MLALPHRRRSKPFQDPTLYPRDTFLKNEYQALAEYGTEYEIRSVPFLFDKNAIFSRRVDLCYNILIRENL